MSEIPVKDPGQAVWLSGASVRALAESAKRAGFSVHNSDLFCDQDTQITGRCRTLTTYPESILEHSHEFPGIPLAITGGLENYPDLVAQIHLTNPLWCCQPDVMRSLKDPFKLARELQSVGISTPEVRVSPPHAHQLEEWLVKARSSAGGLDVRKASDGPPNADSFYFQRFETGQSISAVWLVGCSQAWCLGITRQLLGVHPLTGPFAYGGSIGPIAVSNETRKQLDKVGRFLFAQGVRGLVGCDFVSNSNGLHLIEINPRYTQSMELIELSTGQPLFALHAAVFDPPESCLEKQLFEKSIQQVQKKSLDCASALAKLIVYADVETRIGPAISACSGPIRAGEDLMERLRSTLCTFADLPENGQLIEAGHPLCSMIFSMAEGRLPEHEIHREVIRLTTAIGYRPTLGADLDQTFS